MGRVTKDRPGFIRAAAAGRKIAADVEIVSEDDDVDSVTSSLRGTGFGSERDWPAPPAAGRYPSSIRSCAWPAGRYHAEPQQRPRLRLPGDGWAPADVNLTEVALVLLMGAELTRRAQYK